MPFRSSVRPRSRAGGRFGKPRQPAGPHGVWSDEQINAEWDLLIRVASHAWSWRDPESFDTLEEAVTRLRSCIDRDWSA